MAQTNFAALDPQQKVVWSRDVWKNARDGAFISRFTGTGDNNVCQRVTELTKTEKGEKCIMHLLADLVEDGIVGDDEREGNEEAMQTYTDEIQIDLISHGVRNKGKMADQKSVVVFREHARDRLSYWLSNRVDQLAFLTLSGIAYTYKNDGSSRSSSAFANLAFAADVTAPTSNRHRRWDSTNGLSAGDTTAVDATDLPEYAMIVDLISYAKDHYVKGLNAGGKEYFVMFVKPGTLGELKKDADYQRAVTNLALKSGTDSPWFTGGQVTIDGVVFHEHRLVFSTKGASSGSKWGAASAIDGTRSLLCGAQALGMADLGPAEWNEKTFQYGSSQGINVDKMFGFLKPRYTSIYDSSTVQDFGVIACDTYLP